MKCIELDPQRKKFSKSSSEEKGHVQVYVKQQTHIIGFYERHAWTKHHSWPQKIFLYHLKFVFFWVGKILCYYIYIYDRGY
jgi:hypothetical protein